MSTNSLNEYFRQALTLHQSGRLAEAESLYRQIMRADPRDYPSRCMLGRLRIEQGQFEEAEKILESAIRISPDAPQGLSFYGVALLRQRKFEQAAGMLERAVVAAPNDATQRRNLGDALRGLRRFAEALASYDQALALEPNAPDLLAFRAETLLALKRFDEALDSAERALMRAPEHADALRSRAMALAALNRNNEAIAAYGALLRIRPRDAFARGERAHLLALAERHQEAVADFDTALRTDQRNTNLLVLRGMALSQLRRFDQAIASYDAALAIDASLPEAHFNRGLAFDELGRFEEAIASYEQAIALRPDHIAAMTNRCAALGLLRRYAEARTGIERILEIEPDQPQALGSLAHLMMITCDWSRRNEIETRLRTQIESATSDIQPGTLLGYFDDPALLLVGARNHAKLSLPTPLSFDGPKYQHDRIRVAYLSADFHDHATARLAVELFERHDRSRFEIIGISFGPDDGSELQSRTRSAFDKFHDVRAMNNADVVALLRRLEIDIAVDLKGYTLDARASIFARRAAPIQVNYLGFPGTLGADCYDYVLADAIVAPMELQPHFVERIVHLPQCYQPNDSKRAIPQCTLTRKDAGLPEQGIVFCSFNNNFKITPAFFDVWMRLLNAVENSVLWLIEDNADASTNLRREAATRGVDPQRLVFAARVSALDHLARHALADMLLDTLPYGAHTTGSDALWMGVPLVTCIGQAFAGRVGASLCHAAGLSELVAGDLAEYEQIALSLARDPHRLAAIKKQLIDNRTRHALFDAAAHCKGVEAAYETMYARYCDGTQPEAFAVTTP